MHIYTYIFNIMKKKMFSSFWKTNENIDDNFSKICGKLNAL